jgi:hypothetical protein
MCRPSIRFGTLYVSLPTCIRPPHVRFCPASTSLAARSHSTFYPHLFYHSGILFLEPPLLHPHITRLRHHPQFLSLYTASPSSRNVTATTASTPLRSCLRIHRYLNS